MILHKLEVYVYDFEYHGIHNVIRSLEDGRDWFLSVQDSQTVHIRDWSDDHILNKKGTPIEVFRGYFGVKE